MKTSFAQSTPSVAFLDLRAAYEELREEMDAATGRVLATGWYLLGEELEQFESEYAAYIGSKHCVGVANGLDALTLVLRAWGIGPGDEVLVPSNTYIATWLAVSAVGARPVPVEPNERSYVIEADAVRAALTPATRAVIPVHLYGMAADVEAIAEVCHPLGVRVLDDAAQGHGATVRGKRVGSQGDAAAWSFYPTKNLGALGDAGAVTTNDARLAEQLRVLRNYGSRKKYVNEIRGVNSRLDEIQAAILRVKLPVLDEWNARRGRIASAYLDRLADVPVELPAVPPDSTSVWHVFVIRVQNRDAVRAQLAKAGVETLIHYPTPPHAQGAYADLGIRVGELPISERIHREVLSLPIGPHMEEFQVKTVVDALTEIVGAQR
jgi:dTDP-4-amino-4,6-dideoxygalactose transaminase